MKSLDNMITISCQCRITSQHSRLTVLIFQFPWTLFIGQFYNFFLKLWWMASTGADLRLRQISTMKPSTAEFHGDAVLSPLNAKAVELVHF